MRAFLITLGAATLAVAETYRRGYAWPILLTAAALVGRRPTTPYTEPEIVA